MATLDEIKKVLTGFPNDLKWTSFRSVTNSPSPPHQAQAATTYRLSWTGAVSLAKGVYRIAGLSIKVSVNGPGTWAVAAARSNPALLRHEQGHYDITGLAARDMASNLLDLTYDEGVVSALVEAGKTAASRKLYVQRQLKAAFEQQAAQTKALVGKLQTDPQTHQDGIYDVQTQHGVNQAAQTVWDERFARMKLSNTNFALALTLAGVR